MRLGFGLGLGKMYGIASAVQDIIYWLSNVLDGNADVGDNTTFSRGDSGSTSIAYDDTLGVKLVDVGVNVPANNAPMRYDSGVWYNDDGSGNALHPTTTFVDSDGGSHTIYLEYSAWTNSEVVPAGGIRTDFDGVHNKYYSTVLGGTTNGTGVADDTGVTDWVEGGKYSNNNVLPGLKHIPAETNQCVDSRTFDGTGWFLSTSNPTITKDSVGIDGVSNTASTIVDDNNSAIEFTRHRVTIDDDSNTHIVKIHVGKDSDETRFPSVYMQLSNGVGVLSGANINTKTGQYALLNNNAGTGTFSVESFNSMFWEVTVSATNNGTGNTALDVQLQPARNNVFDGGASGAATGSAVFDQVDIRTGQDWVGQAIETSGSTETIDATSQSGTVTLSDYTQMAVSFDSLNACVFASDATNKIGYDGTNLYVTDGTDTLNYAVTPTLGQRYVVGWDNTAGKLYWDGSLVGTDATVAITSGTTWYWGCDSTTGSEINGTVTYVNTATTLDLTDITWLS